MEDKRDVRLVGVYLGQICISARKVNFQQADLSSIVHSRQKALLTEEWPLELVTVLSFWLKRATERTLITLVFLLAARAERGWWKPGDT